MGVEDTGVGLGVGDRGTGEGGVVVGGRGRDILYVNAKWSLGGG